MKVSFLLPTRNRLDLLKAAVDTVRRQDGDWQLVVSDNDSEEDIGGYLATLDDSRIVYHRTDRFVPVTENWNAALQRSSGDFIVMLGDDDGLLPGYVEALGRIVEHFHSPDVVYTSALLLTYPAVLNEQPDGFLVPYGYASFLRGATEPFLLGRDDALRAVRAAMDFRLTYGYNSQFVAISRRLIDELGPHGPFYQSRFPDYYSTNVAFLKARAIAVDPAPRVVIGVSPKSYGFYHQNNREEEGRAFLDGPGGVSEPELEPILLPGSNINVGWLSAIEAIQREYGAEFGLEVNRARFRRLQAAHVYEQHFIRNTLDARQLAQLEARLRPYERLLYRAGALGARGAAKLLPARLRRSAAYFYARSLRQFPTWDPARLEGRYGSVVDVFERHGRAPG